VRTEFRILSDLLAHARSLARDPAVRELGGVREQAAAVYARASSPAALGRRLRREVREVVTLIGQRVIVRPPTNGECLWTHCGGTVKRVSASGFDCLVAIDGADDDVWLTRRRLVIDDELHRTYGAR
jgi:hypothetical protein